MGTVNSALGLGLGLVCAAGCPLFEDEPEDEYQYCSESFDITDTPDLVFDLGASAAVWRIDATFTGVGRDHGDGYGPFLDIRAYAVAVSNDPEVDTATAVISLGEVGAAEPWISEASLLTVGAPQTQLIVDDALSEHLEAACDGQETCTLSLELRIESLDPAVVVFHQLVGRIRSSMNTERYEGCGLAEHTVETGPSPSGETDDGSSGSGESTG